MLKDSKLEDVTVTHIYKHEAIAHKNKRNGGYKLQLKVPTCFYGH